MVLQEGWAGRAQTSGQLGVCHPAKWALCPRQVQWLGAL